MCVRENEGSLHARPLCSLPEIWILHKAQIGPCDQGLFSDLHASVMEELSQVYFAEVLFKAQPDFTRSKSGFIHTTLTAKVLGASP